MIKEIMMINTGFRQRDTRKDELGRGVQMRFENGLVLSVQFGYGNYCDNRDNYNLRYSEENSCSNAEVAVFEGDVTGKWRTQEFFPDAKDDVAGWVTPDELAKVIPLIAAWKPKEVV
jgi:hypothetical protein